MAFILLSRFFSRGICAAVGVIASSLSISRESSDPQFVVIDEVSGQWLTSYSCGCGPGRARMQLFGVPSERCLTSSVSANDPANWKYLLLGFILFRGFDIWKPPPVRQLESLPGGWGIMADDWAAAVYAAAGLWIARWFGL